MIRKARLSVSRSHWVFTLAAVPAVIAAAGPAQAHTRPAPPAPAQPVQVEVGNLRANASGVLDSGQVRRVNESAAAAESQLELFYGRAGMAPARAHSMAANTLGDAVVGAGIGMAAAGPLVAASGLVGGVAGLVAGVPFLPIGLLIGPAVGAGIGAGVILAPAAAVGGGIGALAGAAAGAAAPTR